MRGAGQTLADDPHDLLQLFAQPLVGVQPAGGVHEHSVDPPRHRGINRVERHRRRIAAL